MAAATGTYLTTGASAAVGQREDLSDLISNIDYTVTPFISSISRGKASAITHEWQNDTYRAPGVNAAPEGNEPTFAIPARTTRPSNTCQIFQEQLLVSGTLDAVSKAGRKTELGYQLAKKLKELARDQELAYLLEDEQTSEGGGFGRSMNGLRETLVTNAVDGGAADLDEDAMDDAMELVWNVTGESNDFRALMSTVQKRKVTAFTGHANTQLNIDIKEKKLVNSVRVYDGDFGMLMCVPHTMMGTNQTAIRRGVGYDPRPDVYLYQPAYCKKAILRALKTEPLAKTGDATKRHLVSEETLQNQNERAHARIFNLTTA